MSCQDESKLPASLKNVPVLVEHFVDVFELVGVAELVEVVFWLSLLVDLVEVAVLVALVVVVVVVVVAEH